MEENPGFGAIFRGYFFISFGNFRHVTFPYILSGSLDRLFMGAFEPRIYPRLVEPVNKFI
jgi:hypothetical protein